jgi:hypothetical protein
VRFLEGVLSKFKLVGVIPILISLLSGCSKSLSDKEFFELRSKCDEISQKKYTQNYSSGSSDVLLEFVTVESHYVASKNLCLAFVTTDKRSSRNPNFDLKTWALYDAQSGRTMARRSLSLSLKDPVWNFAVYNEEPSDGSYNRDLTPISTAEFEGLVSRKMAEK